MKNNVLIVFMALVLMLVVVAGCNKPDEPNQDGDNVVENDSVVDHSGSLNGRDYIDLGLPSGLLWATCNVGAEVPEDYGDFFAWGETAPKELYDWKSYKYSSYVQEHYELNKYCSNSCWGYNGFVDSLTVLENGDDAVMANWADDWRMPTREEWEELYQNTTFVWTAINGVEGRLLTGQNGNSIFLPATGFRLDGELICPGLGIYWSSTLQTSCSMSAWSFHFDWESCHVCGTYERSRGQVVRAVRFQK